MVFLLLPSGNKNTTLSPVVTATKSCGLPQVFVCKWVGALNASNRNANNARAEGFVSRLKRHWNNTKIGG
jgi:hypothetical protein